jgi:hypothetical protein
VRDEVTARQDIVGFVFVGGFVLIVGGFVPLVLAHVGFGLPPLATLSSAAVRLRMLLARNAKVSLVVFFMFSLLCVRGPGGQLSQVRAASPPYRDTF